MNNLEDIYDGILLFTVIISVLTTFFMVCIIASIYFLEIGKFVYAIMLLVIATLIIGWLFLSSE
jgi:hypothetical protein